MRKPEQDDPMTLTMTDTAQECHHSWHPCGWQIDPGDHNCSHLFNDVNTDPPFWKAVDQLTPDQQLITYRCDNCGEMGSLLINQGQYIVASTMPNADIPLRDRHTSQSQQNPLPTFAFPTDAGPPITPSLPGL